MHPPPVPALPDSDPDGGPDVDPVAGGETDGAADEPRDPDGLDADVSTDPVPVVTEAHPPTSTAAPAARSANRSDMWPSSWVREGA
jgi:hypothetical protein